jgi:transcriptional regulator with XRE-family HTH domain
MKRSNRPINSPSSVAMRELMQNKGSSVRAVARDLGVSPTTVQKWRQRATLSDAPGGPKTKHLALAPREEAIVILTRWFGLFSLDDCLRVLDQLIPQLRRSSLHRCLQRYGIGCSANNVPAKLRQPASEGCFRIGATKLVNEDQAVWLCVAIDGRTRLALVDFCDRPAHVSKCLAELATRFPFGVQTVVVQGGPGIDEGVLNKVEVPGVELPAAEPFRPWQQVDLSKMEAAIQAGLGQVASREISTLRRAARRYSHKVNRAVGLRSSSGRFALHKQGASL